MNEKLRKKKILVRFKKLTDESFDKKAQFIKLKKNVDYLWNFFLWKYKDLYLELFVDFVNYNISGDEFTEQFIKLRFSHINKFDQLLKELEINFQARTEFSVNSRAFNFNRIIRQVYEDSDAFVSKECLENLTDKRHAGEIDENELRSRIQKVILKIQKIV